MANNSGSATSASINIVTLSSGVYAYATIPALTGLQGAFTAAMTGFGTSVVAGLYAAGGGLLGAAFGCAVGALGGRAKRGAIIGGLVCGLGSAVYGIPQGYDAAKDIIINGTFSEADVSEIISEPANDNVTSSKSLDLSHVQKRFPHISMPTPG